MKHKSNLDEMQEQELSKIEHNGCWLVFWLLLAAMIVQSIAYGKMDFMTLAGEWVVFMVLSLYMAFACVRKGIWDRRIPMNTKANLIVSLIAAVVVGLFNAVIIFKNYQKPAGTLLASLITAVITFAACFLIVTFMMKKTQKRIAQMEAEPLDADER